MWFVTWIDLRILKNPWILGIKPIWSWCMIFLICCLQVTHLKTRDTYRQKVQGWKKIFHANRDQKKAGVAILISDKIDFEIKAMKRDKEGYYIMIKGSIQEEDITIINIYAPNMGSRRVRHNWATSLSLFTFMHWRRKWQPTPVFLPRESQGWESLVGCRLWGRTELDMTEST